MHKDKQAGNDCAERRSAMLIHILTSHRCGESVLGKASCVAVVLERSRLVSDFSAIEIVSNPASQKNLAIRRA
jgi:hypothetical protein